jgi:exopolyphosphatase/guanosine-5'-triphosphate,3'-diphosphate pyrophosphatase
MMSVIAAIDIGTNSILLTVAELGAGEIRTLCERSHITRLGEGLNATGRLGVEPIRRSLEAVRQLLDEANRLRAETVLAVGTEVLRKASNAGDFVRACEAIGLRVEVITGEREAFLSYLSVAKDPLFAQRAERLTMLDVGGGSTEISHGRSVRLEASLSYPIGAVRLTEGYLHTDPPTADEITALQQAVRQQLQQEPPLQEGEYLVGVGGTFVNLASLHGRYEIYDPSRVHGAVLSLQAMHALANELCALPVVERRQLPGIEPDRAPVLHAGALIVLTVMQALQAEQVAVSMRGLRWGVIYEYADAHRD